MATCKQELEVVGTCKRDGDGVVEETCIPGCVEGSVASQMVVETCK